MNDRPPQRIKSVIAENLYLEKASEILRSELATLPLVVRPLY